MMRWFRRHQRHLLAAAVVLLMFAWGLGPALQKAARRSEDTMGTIRGEEVTEFEIHSARGTLRVALALQLLDYFVPVPLVFGDQGEIDDEAAWRFLVLSREATATGIGTTLEEVRSALAVSPSLSDGVAISRDRFRAFLNGYRLSEDQVRQAIEELLNVAKLVDLHRSSVAATNAELWAAYHVTGRKVSARYVIVEGEWFEDLVDAEPEALAELHEQYKDVQPDREQGTPGYLAPARVRVECARPAMDRLRAAATVEDDEIAAYYEGHKEEFLVEEGADGGSADADEDESAGPTHRPLDEVRELIREILVDQRAQTRAGELVERALADLKAVDSDFAHEPLPLARMARRHDLDYLALTTAEGRPLLSREELQLAIPQGVDVASFAFAETDDLYQPRRFTSPDGGPGSAVICQVLERRPEEPQPFEEVQEQVRRDYIAREALDRAGTFAGQIQERAREAGLAAAADELRGRLASLIGRPGPVDGEEADDLLTVAETGLFGRSEPFIEGLDGWHPAFTDAVLRLTGDEVGVAKETTPSSRCYVLQVSGSETPTADRFTEDRPMLQRAYLYGKQAQALADWMDGLVAAAEPGERLKEG